MKRLALVVVALFAGCPPPDEPAQVGMEGSPAEDTDHQAAFRDLADRTAARTESRVAAWGAAPLADDDQRRRFAVLVPDEPMTGRGAYLIEERPGRVWRVSFQVDGRTMPWGLEPGASHDDDPTWQTRDDRAVDHTQGHHHGGEVIEFAQRDGTLVVLLHEFTGDADTEVTERRRFAENGVCSHPCPALAGFVTEDADLRVTGPAGTVDALTVSDH